MKMKDIYVEGVLLDLIVDVTEEFEAPLHILASGEELCRIRNRIITLESQLLKAREEALEEAAQLCERVRCRNWDAKECAEQIREQLIQRHKKFILQKDSV